jgi:hypothetical protein
MGQLQWAHYPPDSAFSGPIGRLEALKLGFKTDYEKVRVCVETGKKTIADADVMLESRLAYAAWLDAAGYTDQDWQRFEFVGATKCKKSDNTFSAFVVLATLDNLTAEDEILEDFSAPVLKCKAEGGRKSCQGSGMTLGWGGPGSMSYWYLGRRDKWTKLSSSAPSSTWLSPYVDWISLGQDLKRQPDDALAAAVKDDLSTRYAALSAAPGTSFEDLALYARDLASAKLTATADPVFPKLCRDFYASTARSVELPYQTERAAFNTLLHEVGHQLGMDHAHHPDTDSVTGETAGAKKNEAGQWVSDDASMAYGLPFQYLTADDAAGVKDDAAQIRAFLAAKQ